MTLTVLAAATTTTIEATPESAEFGLPIALSARIATAGAGRPVSGGSVRFTADGAAIGAPVPVDAAGVADAGEIGTLSVGAHTIEAEYLPDGDHRASDARTVHHVGTASTRLALASSANPAPAGGAVRFTATVDAWTPGLHPTGTVAFFADGQAIGAPVAVSPAGAAVSPSTVLAPGSHRVEAHLVPSGPYRPSAAELTQAVAAPPGGGGGEAASGSGEGGVPDGPLGPPIAPPIAPQPAAPVATVSGRTAVVGPDGTTHLVVACAGPVGARCQGRLVARGAAGELASRLVAIPAGATERLAVDLDRAGERAVSAGGRVTAAVAVAGGPATEVTLRATRAPRLRARAGALRADADGRVTVRARCAADRCAADLALLHGEHGRVAHLRLAVPGHRWARVRLDLDRAARERLRRDGELRLRLRARSTVRVGLPRTHVTTTTVRTR
jgi:hypothetical protein